jgi:hypothetical protein
MYWILYCIEGSALPVVTGFEVLAYNNSPSNVDYHFLLDTISRLLCFVYIDHLSLYPYTTRSPCLPCFAFLMIIELCSYEVRSSLYIVVGDDLSLY